MMNRGLAGRKSAAPPAFGIISFPNQYQIAIKQIIFPQEHGLPCPAQAKACGYILLLL
jgi:hypothetical protein